MNHSNQLLRDPIFYGVLIFFALLSTALPVALGMRLLMPFMQTVILTIFVSMALRRGLSGSALVVLGSWLLTQLLVVTIYSFVAGELADRALSDGFEHRTALAGWLYGAGAHPNSWSQQPLARLIELTGVVVGALLSGGLVALWFVVDLVNHVGFAIGTLWRSNGSLAIGLLAGLPIWTLLRIAGYLGLIATLGEFIFAEDRALGALFRRHRPLLVRAVALIVISLVLELLISNLWRSLLA